MTNPFGYELPPNVNSNDPYFNVPNEETTDCGFDDCRPDECEDCQKSNKYSDGEDE